MLPAAAEGPKAPNPLLVGVVLIAALGSLALMPATFLLLFGMMGPAMAMAFIDRNRDQMRVQTMASLNAAAGLPTLITLWNKGNTIDVAISMLLQPGTIIAVAGSSLCGWLLLVIGPQLAARAITYMNKREAQNLKVYNRQLLQTWGEDMPEDAQRVRMGKSID